MSSRPSPPKRTRKPSPSSATSDPDLPPLQGDAERLRQVFVNLTDNAIKFSPSGGVVRLVAAPAPFGGPSGEEGFSLLEPSRRMIEVRVIDSGIGIDESERERIFDPFYQVDSSSTRKHEGTGLGLSIVKRLVDAHGGRVFVSANVPSGAVFSVALPLGAAGGL